MRVGVHTSIAGGVENAAHHANKLGCDGFQMFSANPRGWRSVAPSPDKCERFREVRLRYRLNPAVVHDNYLINLAAADVFIREMSIAAFRAEIGRAAALGANYLVAHPGSAKGATPALAIANCVESLSKASDGARLDGLMILIENTAGQGSAIGRTLEEVAEIVSKAGRNLPIGACIDTAHCFAAGYPIHTAEGLESLVRQIEQTVGLNNVRVIHANDSKSAFDSHSDRHEHIGKGQIGADAFRRILRHPKLEPIPFICETPVDKPRDDARNLRTMRKLAAAL
ncbi:MAG: deoxyribonuclease IV [Terriglobia bacterium]